MPGSDSLPDRWTPEVVRVAASLVFDQEDAVRHLDALAHGAAPDSEAWIVQQVLDHSGVAAERDSLRAENGALKAAKNEWADGYADGIKDAATLRTENERLREALIAAGEKFNELGLPVYGGACIRIAGASDETGASDV